MEAVNALRQAIAAKAPIALEKGAAGEPVLVIAGARYPGTLDTGIAKPTGQRRPYKLLPLYLVWLHEKSPYTVLLRALTVAGVPVTESVPANDKAAIVNYLEGREELPAGRLLEGADGRAGASGAAAAAAAAGLLAIDEATAPLTLADVVKEEIPYRSRASVLSLPGKNIKDMVYKYLQVDVEETRGAKADAAAAARAAAKGGAGAAPLAGTKRPREADAAADAAAGSGDVRFIGTPIIIVSPAATALINLYNVREFLEDKRFVTPTEAAAAAAAAGNSEKPTKVTITRKDNRGVQCRYHVIDNIALLQKPEDWARVVAVFVLGPDWQFKGWRWGRPEPRPDITPVEIFERALGFYPLYDGDAPHENATKWAVTMLPFSRSKRYMDAPLASQFWAAVDNFIFVKKRHVLHRAPAGGSVGGGAGGAAAK